MIDAATSKNMHSELHLGSRVSALARALRVELLTMAESAKRTVERTMDANQITVKLVAVIAAFLAFSGTLVLVTWWAADVSHRADASVTTGDKLNGLETKLDVLSGQMQIVVGVQGDVIKLRSDVENMRTRQGELFEMLETNRAYTQKLTDAMRDAGIRPPDRPSFPQPRRP